VATRRPAAIRGKAVMALEVTCDDALMADHAQVRLQVNTAIEHMDMFVVAGGAGKSLNFGQFSCPARIPKFLGTVGVFRKLRLVAAHAGVVGDGLEALVARATGGFDQIMTHGGLPWQKNLLVIQGKRR